MSRRPNGEGTVFRLKNGRWRAEITIGVKPDGRPIKKSRTGRTKTEAFRLLEELKAQYATEDATEFPVDMTVQAWCEHWLEHGSAQSVLDDTRTNYRWVLEQYVFPQIGSIELKRLRPPALDRWQSSLVARGFAPGTVKVARGPLSSALNQAFRLGLIQSNPLQPIRTPKKDHGDGRRRWLEPEEHNEYIKLFTDHYDLRLSAYVLVMLHRGLRKEEVTGLRWEAIDIDARQLDVKTRVRRERRRGSDGVYVTTLEEGPLKSATSYRQVTLNGPLIDALMEWKKEQTRIRWQTGGWPDDWVFTTKTGRPVDSRNMERAYKKAIDNAGLPYVSFHDLRRTIG
ncbi:MAG: site-specific integrase, partial [Ilumatobacteraceae bacterium]